MATAKQIEANRRNAQKSTGPRTAEGKAASKFNALNHGLRADQLALPHENKEHVQAFVDAIIEAIAPRDAMEAELASEIATLSWKLRRAERYEHAVLSKRMHALDRTNKLEGEDEEDARWNLELASYDDDPDGQRRRRYITGLRNSLSRARKELRLWVEAHPEPEPIEEPEPDQPEPIDEAEVMPKIGFVRQDSVPLECGSAVAAFEPQDLPWPVQTGGQPVPQTAIV